MKHNSIFAVIFAAVIFSSCGETDEVLPESGTIGTAAANSERVSEEITASVTETITETSSQTEEEKRTETVTESLTESEKSTETATGTTAETKTQTEIATTAEIVISAETATEIKSETETLLKSETSSVSETENSDNDFSEESAVKIIYNGKCVSLDEITDVKEFFGTPSSPAISAPSCLGEGEDIVYFYDGFNVTVFKSANGKEKTVGIIVTSDKIQNPKGINVGEDEKTALSVLGDSYYEENGCSVSFFSENGIITEVDYNMSV